MVVEVVQHSRVALAQCTLSRKREELSWTKGVEWGKWFWNRVMMKWFCWLPAQAPESSGSLSPSSSTPSCFVGTAIWCEIRTGAVGVWRGDFESICTTIWCGELLTFHLLVRCGEEFLSVLLLSAIYYFVTVVKLRQDWNNIWIFMWFWIWEASSKNIMFKQWS